jgi:hypothetical protein
VSVDWLLSTQGRLARIAAGTLLILIGLGLIGGFLGVLLLIIGAVPIASAAYGTLLIGPLFGRDIHGRRPEDQPQDEGGDDEGEGEEDEAEEDADDERRRPKASEHDDDDDGGGRDDDGGRDDALTGDGPSAEDDDSRAPQPPDDDFKLARAERPPGQGPRTKDPRAEE